MYDRTGNNLIVAILIGMILGVIVVALFGESALPVKFLGDIFLNALKMVVIPLLFCSMIVGITKLGDVRKLGRTGIKTLLYFLATSSVAVAIGLILVNIFQPGDGFILGDVVKPEITSYSFFDWLTAQIPSNIVGAAAETKVLPIIVFAIFLGGVLTTIGSKGRPVVAFFEGLNEAIMKIVHIIMWFAPLGIFGLVVGQLAAHGGLSGFSSVLTSLFKYSLVVILGLLIHGVIVLSLILKFRGGKNPIEYLIGMSQALMTAFATASSSATLPVTMDCVEEKNDIDKRASSFVLPLGATVNMDGTALYEAVAAMFIAQAYGIDLSIFAQITIFVTAVLASIGAAGIPEAGLVTMVLVLQAVGLPLEGIGLILAIDWFLDRCRTTVNVWGDSIGAAVIATTAEIGLVDRRPRKSARDASGRTSRPERTERRKDPRFKKKGHDAAKDRKPVRGKKPDKPVGKITRRPTTVSPVSKRETRGSGRSVKKVQATEGFRMSEQQETYKPSMAARSEKDQESRTSRREDIRVTAKPSTEAASEKRTEKPTKSRQSYGRKVARNRPAKPTADDSGKIKTSGPAERTEVEASTSEYVVPKFPANTLESLKKKEDDESFTSADDVVEVTTDSDRAEQKEPVTPTARQPRSKPEPVSTDDIIVDAVKDTDEFARLDRMIIGDADKTEIEKEKIESETAKVVEPDEPVSSEKAVAEDKATVPQPAISNDFDVEIKSSPEDEKPVDVDSDSVEGVPETAASEIPASIPEKTTPFEPVSRTRSMDSKGKKPMEPVSEVRETVSEEPSIVPDPPAEITERQTTEKETEKTEPTAEVADSDGSTEKEEPMQWGRTKRKKINR